MDGQVCSQCSEPSMNNGSGLCEPHFEARRAALKEQIGPVPATKTVKRSAKPDQPKYSAWKLSVAIIAAVLLWWLYISPDGNAVRESLVKPSGFEGAAAGEYWRVDDENVALLQKPEQPDSELAFSSNLIMIVPSGSTVRIVGSQGPFKQVIVSRPPHSIAGWIQSQTVDRATRL